MLRGKERERRRGRGGGLVKRDRRGKGVCRGCGGGWGVVGGGGRKGVSGDVLVSDGREVFVKGENERGVFSFP